MEGGLHAAFVKGANYTRAEIRAVLGGSARAALPTRGGKVVCACLTREVNPGAPREVAVGAAPGAVRRARGFAASGSAVPVFVRVRPGAWEYAGNWRAVGVKEMPAPTEPGGGARDPAAAVLVLTMEEDRGVAQCAPSSAQAARSGP